MGPEEAVVTESPTPENPGGPSVPPAPEQEAEQGTIPGMEEKADPSETVIDLAAARKAVKEQAGAPPAGPGGGAPGSDGPGGDGGKTPEPEKKPARRGRRPKAEQEAPGGGPTSSPAAGAPPVPEQAPEPTAHREPPRSGETEQIVYIDLPSI